MKQIVLALCIFANLACCKCTRSEYIDKMTDEKKSYIVCQAEGGDVGGVFYLYDYKQNLARKRISDINETMYAVFALPNGIKLKHQILKEEHDFQEIKMRADKNSFFKKTALILDDHTIGVHFTQDQIKELVSGKRILIQYQNGEKAEIGELDISDLRKYY